MTGVEILSESKHRFNKKILAMLLEKARGNRTTRQFSQDCGISYVQLHKLENMLQENPPGRKLIKKLAENSENGIELEDYFFACGIDGDDREKTNDESKKCGKSLNIQKKYDLLSHGQKKTVYDFIDYLLNYKK